MENGLEKIIEQILAEADEKSQQIIRQAEKFAEDQMNETAVERRRLMEEATDRGRRDAATLEVRAGSLIETNERKLELMKRQEIVQRVIDNAVEQLNSRSDAAKIAYYIDLIKSNRIERGEIQVNAAEQHLLPMLIEKLGETFFAAEKPARILGGVLIRRDNIVENFSYDLCIRNNRPELSAIAAKVLFDGMD